MCSFCPHTADDFACLATGREWDLGLTLSNIKRGWENRESSTDEWQATLNKHRLSWTGNLRVHFLTESLKPLASTHTCGRVRWRAIVVVWRQADLTSQVMQWGRSSGIYWDPESLLEGQRFRDGWGSKDYWFKSQKSHNLCGKLLKLKGFRVAPVNILQAALFDTLQLFV